jgi:oligopeptide/dipeptide ABC transporter ATP-binding protein
MWRYILRRLAYMLLLLVLVSVTTFTVIQLPPGDYLTNYIQQLEASGQRVDQSEIEAIKRQYGLDLPITAQYFKWATGMLRGDFGRSLQWNTEALLRAVPKPDPDLAEEPVPMIGEVADPADPPPGCTFHPRCPHAQDVCRTDRPVWDQVQPGHFAACHFARDLHLEGA